MLGRKKRCVSWLLLAGLVVWAIGGCATVETTKPRTDEAAGQPAPIEETTISEETIESEDKSQLPESMPDADDSYIHQVRWQGETLSIIAKWYTGNYRNWKTLAKLNPALNPDRIFVGNRILIPRNLLKTSQQMPPDFVTQHQPVTKAKSPQPKATPPPPPDPEKEEPEKGAPPSAEEPPEPAEPAEKPWVFGPKGRH